MEVQLTIRAFCARSIVLLVFVCLSAVSAHAHAAVINYTLSMPPNSLGLVGWWTFDGKTIVNNVQDSSGSGNTARLVSAATSSQEVAGVFGQALQFNGSTQYVDAGNAASVQLTIGTMTAWIKTTNAGSGYHGIVAKQGAYGMFLNSNVFGLFDWGGTGWHASTVSPNDGRWHFVACSFQSGVTNGTLCYVDGVQKLQTTMTVSGQANDVQVAYANATTQYFAGAIDDARVYNRVLSATEIQQLYYQGTGSHINTTITPANLSNGLVVHWPFDGQTISGTSVSDTSGDSNTGTMNGSPRSISGVLGQALYFNGSTDYVQAADSTSENMTGSLSISFWLDAASWNDGHSSGIVSKKANDSSYGYVIYDDGSSFSCGGGACGTHLNFRGYGTGTASNQMYDYSASNVTVGKWEHWTVVYDSTAQTVTWYKNGVFDDTFTGVNIGDMTSTEPLVAGYSQTWGGHLKGSLDDIRIYNRALSASEVQQLYKLGTASHVNTTINPPNLDSGMVGHWTFDGPTIVGNVQDVSGNGNTASLVNAATSSQKIAGVLGQALKFNGSTQYLLAPSFSTLSMANPRSVSLWVRTTYTAGNQPIFDSGQCNATNAGFQLFAAANGGVGSGPPTNPGGLYLGFWANDIYLYNGIISVANGAWHFVVVTYDGANAYIYFDGALPAVYHWNGTSYVSSAQPVNVGSVITTQNPLEIGASRCLMWSSGQTYFNGAVDDVRVYSRALSGTEVQQLYNLGH